ncbi:MAG: DUF951 domain-containing protein [Synergistetes bacterium]|nr:DUF951 domain-containing protein [Synergistota bacterium]MCX8127369.1 DUF951 domain-containing protein [Synergistota bacterium]MDW8192233.1 DUF951 domain-containing protein [Synergistota bacterium]
MKVDRIVKLKKPHPCGSKEWMVLREGLDFRLRCLGCGREIWISRERLRRIALKNGLQGEDSGGRENKTEVL